jgi:anti-sigma B factor antagonist
MIRTSFVDEPGVVVKLSFSTSCAAGIGVVAVSGELDLYTAPQLREELLLALSAPLSGLVVDLDDLVFLDSTGLGLLIGAMRRAEAGGTSLRIVCTQPDILRILHVSGLDQVLPVDPSVESAQGVLSRPVA